MKPPPTDSGIYVEGEDERLKQIIFKYVHMIFLSISLYIRECKYLQSPKEVSDNSDLELQAVAHNWLGSLEANSSPLQGQYALSTTKDFKLTYNVCINLS